MTYTIRKLSGAGLFLISMTLSANYSYACTVGEYMEDSIPLNSVEIPNADRIKIADMVIKARQWPDAETRGIVRTGGYVREKEPKLLADQRAEHLKFYLIQLGVKEENIWVDIRKITEPDVEHDGRSGLNQLAVTLVPVCEGGCDRLCNDPRVTPTSKAVIRKAQ